MRLPHVRRVVPSLLVALGLTVIALATPSVAGGTAVLIKDFVFEPTNVTIVLGDTMTWTNTGQNIHTATADDGSWSSGALLPGGSYATGPFTRVGTHVYRCTIHTYMQGSVTIVVATPPPTAPPTTPRTTPPTPTPTPTPSATPTASPSPTPSPTASPSATSSTATPTVSPTARPSPSPPAAPPQNQTQLAGVALIAVGVALLGVAFWWRFGRA